MASKILFNPLWLLTLTRLHTKRIGRKENFFMANLALEIIFWLIFLIVIPQLYMLDLSFRPNLPPLLRGECVFWSFFHRFFVWFLLVFVFLVVFFCMSVCFLSCMFCKTLMLNTLPQKKLILVFFSSGIEIALFLCKTAL